MVGYRARMAKKLRLGELLLAVEGIAIARNIFSGTEELASERLDEIRQIMDGLDTPGSAENQTVDTRELDVVDGYAKWAVGYDEVTNAVTEAEHRELAPILGSLHRGRAIDLCCGTGRVTQLLHRLGHDVRGLDQSEDMLKIARTKDRSIRYDRGVLGVGESFLGDDHDLVTCCFALTHFPSLSVPLGEISATLRAGGTAVISDIHPFFVSLDGQSFFNAADDTSPWIRNYVHQFSDYLRAFSANALKVIECREVIPEDGEGAMRSLAGLLRPAAARAAYLGLPTVVIWVLEKAAAE